MKLELAVGRQYIYVLVVNRYDGKACFQNVGHYFLKLEVFIIFFAQVMKSALDGGMNRNSAS